MKDSVKKDFIIKITGVVQGVGFRPFVYRLAKEENLCGYVRNDGDGVIIFVNSMEEEKIHDFLKKIHSNLPTNARIKDLNVECANSKEVYRDFYILESQSGQSDPSVLSPDLKICKECLSELMDERDRRYRYPLINCTYCGPRFTILNALPHDRENTSMSEFPMCMRCKSEYTDPYNRRFHTQATCCPDCGPQYTLIDRCKGIKVTDLETLVDYVVSSLTNGEIVFIKGLGGFHLVANPFVKESLQKVREIKKRPYKPFALMARDLETIKRFFHVDTTEEELLTSPSAPIVLLKVKDKSELDLSLVSPNLKTAGIMLPYTPFHVLLFDHPRCPPFLLMTSANKRDKPIVTDDEGIRQDFEDTSSIIVTNNRKIINRLDDSVCKVVNCKGIMIRRARGFVPVSLRLRWNLSDRIALGGELKNTFSIVKNNNLICSQHIGDLKSYDIFIFFKEQLDYFVRLTQIHPASIICDLNEDYISSQYAEELARRFNARLKRVQHHYAHALSVMAEYGLEEAVSIVADGVGLGDDGTIWGCEIMHTSLYGYRRLATLSPVKMPGGDMASKQPWRMAISHVYHAFNGNIPAWVFDILKVNGQIFEQMIKMLSNNINSPLTSSCGRLFDAVSSLLDICHENTYEGQAAMELEEVAKDVGKEFVINENFVSKKSNLIMLDSQKIILIILDLLKKGYEKSYIAMAFHHILVEALSQAIKEIDYVQEIPVRDVVLSGGVMQNGILLSNLMTRLTNMGFNVFIPREYPPNDGGLSVGQSIYMGD